jgi:hypothetical protein
MVVACNGSRQTINLGEHNPFAQQPLVSETTLGMRCDAAWRTRYLNGTVDSLSATLLQKLVYVLRQAYKGLKATSHDGMTHPRIMNCHHDGQDGAGL